MKRFSIKTLLMMMLVLCMTFVAATTTDVAAASKPKLSKTSYSMVAGGGTEKISVTKVNKKQKVTYTTSDKAIVKVSKAGTLTPVKKGKATIKVTVKVPKTKKAKAKTYKLKATVNVIKVEKTSKRQVVSLNGDWSFTDVSGNESTVTVPHNWDYFDPTNYNPMHVQKTCKYEKEVDVSAFNEGQEVFIKFEAVNKVAKVLVDDVEIGTHTGGYSAFAMDITEAIAGKDKVKITVMNTNATFDTMPVNTDFTHYAGIYRDCSLVAVEKGGYIALEDDGATGVTLKSTAKPGKSPSATVKPAIKVSNTTDAEKEVLAVVQIKNKKGTVVKTEMTTATIPAGKIGATVKVPSMKVSKAHLWNGTKDPYLYTVVTSLVVDGKTVDIDTQKVGFRKFKVKSGKFYLNDKEYKIKGVGMHQQNNKSYVSTKKDIDKSIADIKEMGANALRACHYPHSDYTYKRCDEEGIVVWAEIPYYLITLDSDKFKDNVKLNLSEMIKQNINHPSIIVWGIENEVYYNASQAGMYAQFGMKFADVETTGKLMKELAALADKIDGTRMIGEAEINTSEYADQTATWTTKDSKIDTVGFNVYSGWYSSLNGATEANKSKVGNNLKGRINKFYKLFNNSSNNTTNYVLTEYGAGGCVDTHDELGENFIWAGNDKEKEGYLTTGSFHPEEYQAYCHEAVVRQIYGDKVNKEKRNSKIWAAFAWSLYDFSCYRSEGSVSLTNTKGLITQDRKTKKDAFYLYKALWNTKSYFTHICSSRFTERPNKTTTVKVYSNCSSVKLTVNGKDYGKGKKVQDGVFVWTKVKLAGEGEANKIVAKGTKGSKTYTDTVKGWVYTPKKAAPEAKAATEEVTTEATTEAVEEAATEEATTAAVEETTEEVVEETVEAE